MTKKPELWQIVTKIEIAEAQENFIEFSEIITFTHGLIWF